MDNHNLWCVVEQTAYPLNLFPRLLQGGESGCRRRQGLQQGDQGKCACAHGCTSRFSGVDKCIKITTLWRPAPGVIRGLTHNRSAGRIGADRRRQAGCSGHCGQRETKNASGNSGGSGVGIAAGQGAGQPRPTAGKRWGRTRSRTWQGSASAGLAETPRQAIGCVLRKKWCHDRVFRPDDGRPAPGAAGAQKNPGPYQ